MNKTLSQLSTDEFVTLVERAVDRRLDVWMTQSMDALPSIDEPSSEFRSEFAKSLREFIKQYKAGEGIDLKSFRDQIEEGKFNRQNVTKNGSAIADPF